MTRFDSASKDYNTYRVNYPEDFVTYIKKEFDLSAVADIGCGSGKFLQLIASNCRAIDGIDLSLKMLEKAKLCLPENFNAILFDANDFIEENKYSSIFVSHSFHWLDGKRVLDNLFDSLRNNGKIAIFWNNSIDRNENWFQSVQKLVRKYHNKPISEHRGLNTSDLLEKSRFNRCESHFFKFSIRMSVDDYIKMIYTKSYVSDDIPDDKKPQFDKELREIFRDHEYVEENYSTDLYIGIKT